MESEIIKLVICMESGGRNTLRLVGAEARSIEAVAAERLESADVCFTPLLDIVDYDVKLERS